MCHNTGVYNLFKATKTLLSCVILKLFVGDKMGKKNLDSKIVKVVMHRI